MLPYRFRESTFREYESVIASVVENWPLPMTFTPTKSAETFSCRLRDSIRSLQRNRWETYIPMAKFNEIANDICVSNRGASVIVASREVLKRLDNDTLVKTDQPQPLREVTLDNVDTFHGLAIIHANRLLDYPTICHIHRLSMDTVGELLRQIDEDERDYDIAVEWINETSLRIIS